MGGKTELVDITLPESRKKNTIIEDEIVVLGFPVYSLRIPKLALEYFKTLKGNGNPLIGIVVYGNMETGIVFEQIKKIAEEQNFKLVGAGSFVAKHVYANKDIKVALGRPDTDDLTFSKDFGKMVIDKLYRNDFRMPLIDSSTVPLVIEKAPYGRIKLFIRQPEVELSHCIHCQKCKNMCPAGAITDSLDIIEDKCLRCMSCVKVCPGNARGNHFKMGFMGKVFAYLGKKGKSNKSYL